ncbi:EAL domain-containing protein [Undibacterium terreum]|uniref:PAS domain S-box-containing protein/diguanylate cyclase (GGDEF) domain-containing protein n=1 Tax=Undibacterium terreum TaxID=1224302 RepID=A0A916UC29_9BURK|nr:EAL domain-containing protein [Undibacterium terreum]GGC66884.1 hypothetical protein GCM10011396_12380 [Undibacterium terreum]
MNDSNSNLTKFSRHLWLTLCMFILFAATFGAYVWTEKQIDRANELRQQSFMLAEELRQSSDDLTRMIRTYAATGDPLYKAHFQEILDIRDGKKPRPVDYQDVYWDLVQSDDKRPRPFGEAVPLLELMQRARFTPQELAKLQEAKARSDELALTEQAAMRLLESSSPPTAANREEALRMLHDTNYHQAKIAIMLPINQFRAMADRRTLQAVRDTESKATSVRLLFIVFGVLLLTLLWRMRQDLYAILGGPVGELHMRIARLGSGEFSEPISVAPGQQDSVLGWLSETQLKLADLDASRKTAEQRSQRLTQLYAALSQCNQAIVRCQSEEELFAQLCGNIVSFGGMQLAWIGRLDPDTKQIHTLAYHGAGAEYLSNLNLSASADQPSGQGPTGICVREDRPYWCQDFLHDDRTALWHERAASVGWRASASLPLHRKAEVFGALTVYSDAVGAFDEDVRSLLLEMAMDIDFALQGFDKEAQRLQIENALRMSEQRFRTIVETEPECIKVVDRNGQILEINSAGISMLEAESLADVQKQTLLDFILPDYRSLFVALHQRVLGGENGTLEFEITGMKGTRRWLETHAAPMRNTDGEIDMVLGITRDVTARKEAEARIQYLAHFDTLTGLPNRAQLAERAAYALNLAQRSHQQLALMLLDLDHFKDINDTLGHTVGDTLLAQLAGRLQSVLREEDTVSRLGGDEFIFLLFGVDMHGAAHVAQKILDAIKAPFKIEHFDLNVTGSIGIAMYPGDGHDLEVLSKSADAAMYRAKHEGRNGYRFFTTEMQTRSERQLQLVNALSQALEREQLTVHYQPQISVINGRIVAAEALLRWYHPELGQVSPAEFIPAAEDSGLIIPIGEWVLRQAVRQARKWMLDGLDPMIIAVNLSAVQFRHSDLPNLVTRILDEEGLPAEYLELELTEGVAMHDTQNAVAVMNNLHARGVRMSIDDFGTGYSSLSQLKKFRIYKLKIDQSFVRDISTDPEDKAIVSAIIHMAKSLGLQTIAEGVETAGQLAFLREQGCDEVQGYYYSRPLPAQQFEEFARAKAMVKP